MTTCAKGGFWILGCLGVFLGVRNRGQRIAGRIGIFEGLVHPSFPLLTLVFLIDRPSRAIRHLLFRHKRLLSRAFSNWMDGHSRRMPAVFPGALRPGLRALAPLLYR